MLTKTFMLIYFYVLCCIYDGEKIAGYNIACKLETHLKITIDSTIDG